MDLSEIKAALAAATPGPWGLSKMRQLFNGEVVIPVIAEGIPDPKPNVVFLGSAGSQPLADTKANARLIANAPAWLAALCAEVERLRAAVRLLSELPLPSGCADMDDNRECPCGECLACRIEAMFRSLAEAGEVQA